MLRRVLVQGAGGARHPKAIISDRNTRFTSHFWEALWAGLAAELKRSTAFLPQTNGQTERANRTLNVPSRLCA